MAYEDYWKDDPMPNFTDDVSYYDEELGFYDDFGEKIEDNSADDAAMEDEATADELASPAPAATNVDRDFRETLEDPHTADQIDDPSLSDEAEGEYADNP